MPWIIFLIFVLYIRTLNYNYVTDDIVQRDGYLYDIPREQPNHKFWKMRPSRWYRLFMISMHCVNTFVIYLLWGWAPALLFAVHPLGVWGTVWVTGNYYATTTYFILISYYIIHTFPNIWGALAAMPIYAAALNSTITAVGFPFALGFMGIPMLLPLWMFLRGKRFTTGMKIRDKVAIGPKFDTSFTWRRLVLMTKVIARYIYFFLVPNKLGLFSNFGNHIFNRDEYDKMHKVDGEFWSSLALCSIVSIIGLAINPFATWWFLVFIGVHSQWCIKGQFIAQRYLYLPMIGLCVVVGTVLQHYPYVLTAVVTFLVIRTHLFIPAWKNQGSLLRNDIENFPENPRSWSNASQYYLTRGVTFPSQFYEIGYWLHRSYALNKDDYNVHMDLVAWHAITGNYAKCVEHTERAIELIDKDSSLVPVLREQRDKFKKKLDGWLSLSPHHKTKERRDGTFKEEEGVESNGASEHSGRTGSVAVCA